MSKRQGLGRRRNYRLSQLKRSVRANGQTEVNRPSDAGDLVIGRHVIGTVPAQIIHRLRGANECGSGKKPGKHSITMRSAHSRHKRPFVFSADRTSWDGLQEQGRGCCTQALSIIATEMTEELNGLTILTFGDARSFEDWLDQQTPNAAGAWLKLAKKSAKSATLSKSQAIDAALCYGWIDGQLDKYDDEHWLIRFTPRRARSKWSQVNKDRASVLMAEGRMRGSGLAQIEAAKADRRWAAAYAPASSASVPADLSGCTQRKFASI